MIDPAPTLVKHLTFLLPTLVDGEEMFADASFHGLGSADDLNAPYNIVEYEQSQQQDYSHYWQTDMILSLYRQKPTRPDYETGEATAQDAEIALQEKQCLESGAFLLRKIAEWFQTANAGKAVCLGQFWLTKIGRASNSPQTTIVGEDDTFVHEVRFTITCDTSRAYQSE